MLWGHRARSAEQLARRILCQSPRDDT